MVYEKEELGDYFVIIEKQYGEGDTAEIEIKRGPFQGFIFQYLQVKINVEDEDNEEVRVQFEYHIIEQSFILSTQQKVEFETLLGDIIVFIVINKTVEEDTETNNSRTNNT